MTTQRDIPDFGELLGPFLAKVPREALPAFLCRLERIAAERYREWASLVAPGEAAGLQACARREDEIASRVENVLPATEEQQKAIEAVLPAARDAYRGIFEGLPVREQLRIQAGAELQGSAAWRGLAAAVDDADVRRVLEACCDLEEESSRYVSRRLADAKNALEPARD